MNENALDDAQYTLPGMTCNSTILNKVLFLDLTQQTLTPGKMTDYDATAAFDRVLHSMANFYLPTFGPTHGCMHVHV